MLTGYDEDDVHECWNKITSDQGQMNIFLEKTHRCNPLRRETTKWSLSVLKRKEINESYHHSDIDTYTRDNVTQALSAKLDTERRRPHVIVPPQTPVRQDENQEIPNNS